MVLLLISVSARSRCRLRSNPRSRSYIARPPRTKSQRNSGSQRPTYQQTLLDVRGVTLGALEFVNGDGATTSLLRYIADREEVSPGWMVERQTLERLLVDTLENMPKLERTIISLYFMEELTLTEIGRVLNLHNSRVCQLKQQAILRLRAVMQKRWPGKM